jgi:hypothetical protein
MSPAQAECPPNQPIVYEPASGKLGFRIEIFPEAPDGSGRALIYRPFSTGPDPYRLISEQTAASGGRYMLIGQAGILRFETTADGHASVEANRDIPSQWQLRPC